MEKMVAYRAKHGNWVFCEDIVLEGLTFDRIWNTLSKNAKQWRDFDFGIIWNGTLIRVI